MPSIRYYTILFFLIVSWNAKGQPDTSFYRGLNLEEVDALILSTDNPDTLAGAYYHKARKTFLLTTDACIKEFQRVLPLIENLGQDSILNSAKLFYALPLINAARFTEAFQVIQEVKAYHESKGNKYFLASVNAVEGFLRTELADYDGAFESYLKSLAIYESGIPQNVHYGINDINNRLGILYTYLGKEEKAVEYYTKVRTYSKENNVTYFYRAATSNLAESLMKLGREKEAVPLIKEVIESRNLRPTINNKRRIFLDSSKLVEIEGDYLRAMTYQDSALTYSIELKNDIFLIDNYTSLARLARLNNQREKELRFLILAEEHSLRNKIKTRLPDIYKALAEHYFEANEGTKAARYFKKTIEQNEEVNKTETLNRLEVEEAKREIYAYDKAIQQITRDAELQEFELRKQKISNRWLIGILFVIATLSLFLYRALNMRKKHEKVLAEQNSIIAKNLEDNEVLLKEIHHRVKNNLQLVSSMLNLNLRYVSDSKAKEILLESRNRVKSMALIHQKLYQEEHLKGVTLNTYIESLANNLLHSYRQQIKEIAFKYDVEPLILDVDTLIPIGLILNEIISNALKHAFVDRQKGQIFIRAHVKEKELMLLVKDDGIGYSLDLNEGQQEHFGLSLIDSLCDKLKAKYTISDDNGTTVQLKIREFSLYEG